MHVTSMSLTTYEKMSSRRHIASLHAIPRRLTWSIQGYDLCIWSDSARSMPALFYQQAKAESWCFVVLVGLQAAGTCPSHPAWRVPAVGCRIG